ncbi:MAG: glycosyltransferase family 2 protein [Candidatus Spechtbacterales bacterium]
MMLSIIINHYKSPEVLKLCLKYIEKNAPQGAEIIVTDSETIEKTRGMMHYDFPKIIFLREKENVGFAKSVNRGIRDARGDFFLIINADVMVTGKDAIPKMLAYMEEHEDVGVLGPRLFNINGEYQPSCFRFYTPGTILARRTPFGKTAWGKRELARFLPEPSSDPASTDWLMGSALLVRRKAYEQVGPMDERYFMYLEDTDWCRSFWEKEWKVVYYPDAFFYHYHFRASKKRGAIVDLLTNKYARVHLVSAVKYFRKYGLKIPRYGI